VRHTFSMQWGDVPAWVAIALSAAASVQAWRARRQAREATAGAASLEVSLQRIADALDRSSSAGRPYRSRASGPADPGTAGPAEPLGPTGESAPALPEFNVEFVSGDAYRLRNVGTVPATGVTVTTEPFPEGLTRGLPVDAELSPLASTGPFSIFGSRQSPVPGEVRVTCDQLPEPVRVPLPPRG
jgi:hypothetical protein